MLKLTATGFFLQPASSSLLQQCEALYVYGVLSQMARFTELQYRDLATLGNRIAPEQELFHPESVTTLMRVARSNRAQYVFTGEMQLLTPYPSGISVHFRLFDSLERKYVADGIGALPLHGEPAPGELPPIAPENLNELINQTVARLMEAMTTGPLVSPSSLAPFSSSLAGMDFVLQAHRSQAVVDKVRLYETAIREDQALETAYYHLARIFKNENQYDKSIFYYRETLMHSRASRRNKAIYATEAGISCALLGQADLSLRWWLRATEYDPTYINPYFNIANIYEDREQYREAETYFLKAHDLAPYDFRTCSSLARLYAKMHYWEKALTQYQIQLEITEDDPWCHSDVATCYLNLGNLSKARHHLERILALDPEGDAGQYAQLLLAGFHTNSS